MSDQAPAHPRDDDMHAYLDAESDPALLPRLDEALCADPDFARRFASMAMLHEALSREHLEAAAGRRQASSLRLAGRVRRWAIAAMVALSAGALAVVLSMETGRAEAADRQLARIGEFRPKTCRTYAVRAEDGPERTRGRGRPALAGATLHVGLPGQFVLEGEDVQGRPSSVGCDGIVSWSAPAKGPVRISTDLVRFRGALPGEQHGIPFVDPADGMAELLRSYSLEARPPDSIDGRAVKVVVARRRIDAQRGPREVRLWFDPESSTIVRMSLERLPQANGGPRSVVLELVAESPLDTSFFGHARHHGPGRPVVREE
jgi:hypothetical protein